VSANDFQEKTHPLQPGAMRREGAAGWKSNFLSVCRPHQRVFENRPHAVAL